MEFHLSKNSSGFKCLITGNQFSTEVEAREWQAAVVDDLIKRGAIGVKDIGDLRNLQGTWQNYINKRREQEQQLLTYQE